MINHHPFVSVIVPVYNDPGGIKQCLKAVQEQTYPSDRYEVFAVDNGSTDKTQKMIKEFDDVHLLIEDEVQGSYAARNRGIEKATGDVLAFTDADCTPAPEWMNAGVETLQRENADLSAGRVIFTSSPVPSAAEQFDARANMQNDKGVTKGYAKTANLFVRAPVVDEIGPFPEQLRSGGDVYWTRKATDAGFKLAYAGSAVIEHPAREFRELLRKQYRVGKGHVDLWRIEGRNPLYVMGRGLISYPQKVVDFLFGSSDDEVTGDTGDKEESAISPSVIAVAVACVLVMNLGRIVALITGGRSS